MNILLIDNGTKLLKQLEELLPGHEVVHTWKDFSDTDVEQANLIVLSGGSLMGLVGNEKEFSREIELVRTTTKPVIGICFGCEVITLAYGGTLRRMSERHQGIRSIEMSESGAAQNISVYEGHRWIIDRLPKEFAVLARSEDGPELVKHTSKPIYGFQFHPENLVDKTEGKRIFMDILSELFPASTSIDHSMPSSSSPF